ncbi:ATP-binding protein [Pseudoalteromonas fenneropenaei]|uniref:ATP-binding protein n=1 Tax=Pseudoalteromonas fenneropenaei TaxID=1737459 RepID=A0ABV7CMD4_9GAMM
MSTSDNGQGIAPVQLAHIFEPFYTTARHSGKTGLGLAFANNLVVK